MNRRTARELLMQIAFQMEAQKDDTDTPLFMHLADKELSDELEDTSSVHITNWL